MISGTTPVQLDTLAALLDRHGPHRALALRAFQIGPKENHFVKTLERVNKGDDTTPDAD